MCGNIKKTLKKSVWRSNVKQIRQSGWSPVIMWRAARAKEMEDGETKMRKEETGKNKWESERKTEISMVIIFCTCPWVYFWLINLLLSACFFSTQLVDKDTRWAVLMSDIILGLKKRDFKVKMCGENKTQVSVWCKNTSEAMKTRVHEVC